jgi:AP-4 complex subunit mu-1
MIRNFFVLSPRGDTILAKTYRNDKNEGAHERSHTEALFRTIKFWDDLPSTSSSSNTTNGNANTDADGSAIVESPTMTETSNNEPVKRTGDAPPVLMMPDGFTYFYIKRNGLIFGASTARNVSPNTVLEVNQ